MSMRAKLTAALLKGQTLERDRVMRICTRLIENLRSDLNKKLMSASEKHLAETKFKLASAIVGAVQMKIMSGDDPDAEAEASDLHGSDSDAVGGAQGEDDGRCPA
jgi:hypothetical protein